MIFKKTTLATMMSVGLALGAGEVAAAITGTAGIDIIDLSVEIREGTGALATITTFDFATQNTANLNGVAIIDQDVCSGTVAANSCGPSGAGDVLNSDIQALGAAAYTGIAENAFTFVAPAGVEGSASDSVITDAALVGDAATAVTHLSQAELTTGTSAGASANIRSTTGYTLDFILTDSDGILNFSFDADPEAYAELIDVTASGGTASANHTLTFFLSGNNGTVVTWAPDGSAVLGCLAVGAACVEVSDAENLQDGASAPFGSSDSASFNGAFDAYGSYEINITGLDAGVYSLTLATTSETNLTRIAAVPEPGILLLLGCGLAGLGFTRSRNMKKM